MHTPLTHFRFDHLPANLQEVSKPFHDLAEQLIATPDMDRTEREIALRKLLESKDAAVRARWSEQSLPTFPVYYRPRPYQVELHQMWRSKRYGMAVLPRQSGKDVAASMEQCDARLRTPKTTGVYICLSNPMIRDILWDKTYIDPVSGEYIQGLQDNVPAELVDWKDTVMEGRFSNKSRLKLQGYFQSGQDKSGVGTSFQDYTFTELALFYREDPIPRLMPILDNENEPKRLMVVSTPRGRRKNPLWPLMESLKGNPEAQVIIRTIDDLNEMMGRDGLPPVLTEEELERIRDTYLKRFGNDRMFEQEYYVSFEEMDAAAVYGEAYMRMVREKRVYRFNLNAGHPVYVAFDIGSSGMHSDATAWIAFQYINGRLFIYDCGEGHGKALPEYVDVLREKHYFNQIAQIDPALGRRPPREGGEHHPGRHDAAEVPERRGAGQVQQGLQDPRLAAGRLRHRSPTSSRPG